MKYIMTFEKYQTYDDYKKGRGSWGSPEELKADAILTLKKLMPSFDEKWINSIEDVSVESKGIKFEAKVGKNLIHMFKVGGLRGQWEFYLNKKKVSEADLEAALEKDNMSDLDLFMKKVGSFDFYADKIDNGGQWRQAKFNNSAVKKVFDKLSSSDKKKAIKLMYKKYKKELVDSEFKA
jgi:hypothetical protein